MASSPKILISCTVVTVKLVSEGLGVKHHVESDGDHEV